MAVPKKRSSSTKRNMRRAHDALKTPAVVKTDIGVRLSHRVDPDTGMYRGRQVVKPKA